MIPGTRSTRAWQAVDAAVYALAVAAIAVAASALVATVAFADASGGVVLLTFVLGWLIAGYGVLLLWPRARRKRTDADETSGGSTPESAARAPEGTAFRSALEKLPPLRWCPLPADRRPPAGVKVLLAGLAVLAVSLGVDALLHW